MSEIATGMDGAETCGRRWKSALPACAIAMAAMAITGCSFFVSYTNSPDDFRRIPTSDRANPAVSDVFNDIDTGSEVNIIINDNAIIIDDDGMIIVDAPDDASSVASPAGLKE